MTILDIDIGNTRAKWRTVSAGLDAAGLDVAKQLQSASPVSAVSLDKHADGSIELIASLQDKFAQADQSIKRVRIASVRDAEFEKRLSQGLVDWLGVTPEFATTKAQSLAATVTVKNSYPEPQAMGVDRWCAIVAAAARFSGRPCCVVDAGSAMTIECIDAQAQHIGGYILPGFETQVDALLAKTDRVKVQDVLEVPFAPTDVIAPATNTLEAVRLGVWLNLAGAVREACRQMNADSLSLVICGGAAPVLYQILSGEQACDIHLSESLVFDGICYLLP